MISAKAVAVIFFSAGLSMFVSNMMKIPQSTSLVAVAAIAGVGVYYGQLNIRTLYYLIPFWILLPILSFFLTHWITGFVYPNCVGAKSVVKIEDPFEWLVEKLKDCWVCG